jgi:hypothetical protein
MAARIVDSVDIERAPLGMVPCRLSGVGEHLDDAT